jgi:hypothetical protein
MAERAVPWRTARQIDSVAHCRMARFEASIITTFGEIGPEILEVADVTAAKTAARLTAERLICKAARHLPVSRALTIEIADETGNVLAQVRYWVDAAGTLHERSTEP